MYMAASAPVVHAWPFDWQPSYGLGLYGVGDVATAESTAGIISGAASVGTAAAGALALIPAATIPIIGAAITAATLIITQLIKNSGCGQTCIETSQWANQAEQGLIQNIQAYFSNSPRYTSQQTVALGNFDAIWAQLQATCGQPGTGNAGVRCISDRQAGACTWKQTATSPLLQYPGEPQPGACWNWFSGYRDPIANDPDVQPDPVASVSGAASAVTDAAGNLLSSVGASPSLAPWLLAGAALLVLAVTL